jgi:hypothetical protein
MACPPLAERETAMRRVTRHSLLVGVIAAAVTNRQLSPSSDICTRPKHIRTEQARSIFARADGLREEGA